MSQLPIIFLLHSTGLAGGIKIVLELATRLSDVGYNTSIFSLDQPPSWFKSHVPVSTFHDYDALGNALESTSAFKIATLWCTAPVVAASSRPGEGFYLVQDIETCFYEDLAGQKAVLETYALPLKKLSTSKWVEASLRKLGQDSIYIGLAIDHDIYKAAAPVYRERTMLVNAPRDEHISTLKGMDILIAILNRIRIKDSAIPIVSYSPASVGLNVSSPYRHHAFPSDSDVASLFQSSSCFLITSRHEGFCLPALEAMACGCPVISTHADGNEEFCIPDFSCLCLSNTNPETAAEAVINLLRDDRKLTILRKNGIAIASTYRWESVLKRLADVF